MEIWKPVDWIDGYDCEIEVSNMGRVRRPRLEYVKKSRWGDELHKSSKPPRLFQPSVAQNGYEHLSLYTRRKRQRHLVHRLVARAFVPGYAEGLTVNHKNGVKTDNRAENLEWVTLGRNTAHQWEIGLVDIRGEKHPSHKLTNADVMAIRSALASGSRVKTLAASYGVSETLIYKIRKGTKR
jgi:hypothetical protein